MPSSSEKHRKKNLDAIYTALCKPSLNHKKPFDQLMLSKNSIT